MIQEMQLTNHTQDIQLSNCGMIRILADRAKLGQVLTNLISNALKYSPQNTTITVGYERYGSQVKIYVRDQGIGIEEKHQSDYLSASTGSKTRLLSTPRAMASAYTSSLKSCVFIKPRLSLIVHPEKDLRFISCCPWTKKLHGLPGKPVSFLGDNADLSA